MADKKRFGAAAPGAHDQSFFYAVLLNGEYFTPEYLISPAESDKSDIQQVGMPKPDAPVMVTPANYSYAMLQFAGEHDAGRRFEWHDRNNARLPMITDRSKRIDHRLATTSLHTTGSSIDSDDWHGNVAWGDNHVTFETSGMFDEEMVQIQGVINRVPDDLFLDQPVGRMGRGGNAKMMHRD